MHQHEADALLRSIVLNEEPFKTGWRVRYEVEDIGRGLRAKARTDP